MKNTLRNLCLGICLLGAVHTQAQTRYLEPIFDSYNLDAGVEVGFNVDALRSDFSNAEAVGADMTALNGYIANEEDVPLNYFLSNGDLPSEDHTSIKLFPITLDVYTPPTEDTETNRPVIVYLHTGNFLPPIINGQATGSVQDSALVNLCKSWAKSGYVVAAVNYRMGWNPVSEDPDVRRGTLLNAVYRAIHDTQTGIRYLRYTAAEFGNPYGIDPSKVVLYGQGSGGYVAQAYATLDDYNSEIAIPKFIGEDGFPYVLEPRDGTIDGGPGAIRLPDPLQQAGISKEISMSINAGGAMADISWLEEGDVPMVSFHCVRDPFAPFDDGTVVVPTTGENVVDVSGANVFIQQANDFGNNAAFAGMPDGNPYTDEARSHYGQTYDFILPSQPTMTVASTPEGLFPFVLPINTTSGNYFTNEGSPWDWWDFNTLQAVVQATNDALGLSGENAYNATLIHEQGLAGSPGMGPEKGMAYLDTIQGYANPRIMCALELEGAECTTGISENELDNSTSIYPNPATSNIQILNNEEAIREIRLFDVSGRLVESVKVNAHNYTLERGNLKDGVYIMEVTFDENAISRKVVFN